MTPLRALAWPLALAVFGFAAEGTAPAPIQIDAENVEWVGGPPSLPPNTKVAVLEGSPKKPALFTMRVKLPPKARIAPHWHPKDERVTVLSGSVHVAFGDEFDETRARLFRAGAYYVNPAGRRHYLWTGEGTVLQITTIGPWELHYLDEKPPPQDSPENSP